MRPRRFDAVFADTVQKVVSDAKAAGIPMAAVCERAGAGRATPHRWIRRPPQSVRILADMQRAIVDIKAGR